jgi:hypothetical protein
METESNGEIRDEKGKFAKGNPGKPRGAVVKVSVKVREAIVSFLEKNIDKIQEDFDTLRPKEKLQFVSELLSYAAPKLSAVQTEVKGDFHHKLEITWNEPGDINLPNTQDQGSNGVVQSFQVREEDNS